MLKSGRIETDTTLYKACSPYIVEGGIDVVYDAVLTIEPGVELRFGDGDWLEISADHTRGAGIVARGTAEQPIILTSSDPKGSDDGTWFGLWLNEGLARGSVLSHVVIRAAGGDNTYIKPTLVHGCLTLTGVGPGAATIEHVSLENCVNAGMVLRRSEPLLGPIRIKNAPVGVLLDGVPRDLIGAQVQHEHVALPVAEGPSARPAASE